MELKTGKQSIDDLLEKHFAGAEPHDVMLAMPGLSEEGSPLEKVRIIPGAEFHYYISYGFSLLGHEPDWAEEEFSGFGVEIGIRVRALPGEPPPEWPVYAIDNIARYAFDSGMGVLDHDYFRFNVRHAHDQPQEVEGIIFAFDPELTKIDTPNGAVEILAGFPLGAQALAHLDADGTDIEAWMRELLGKNPRLIWDK